MQPSSHSDYTFARCRIKHNTHVIATVIVTNRLGVIERTVIVWHGIRAISNGKHLVSLDPANRLMLHTTPGSLGDSLLDADGISINQEQLERYADLMETNYNQSLKNTRSHIS